MVQTSDKNTDLELLSISDHLYRQAGLARAYYSCSAFEPLSDIAQLRKLGICAPEQAAPYILLEEKRPPSQPALF